MMSVKNYIELIILHRVQIIGSDLFSLMTNKAWWCAIFQCIYIWEYYLPIWYWL